jgi:hypothetical protein
MARKMGLHLCYRITLPGDTPIEQVRAKVAGLKDFASTLGFQAVYGPEEYSVDELTRQRGSREIIPIIVSTIAGDHPDFYGFRPSEPCVVTFLVAPGKECEPAIFGFVPPGSREKYPDTDDDLCPGEWFWSGACKTQYASIVSNEHLVKCHVGLVRVLDHAIALGIGVSVEDETGYWEHRSAEKLIAAVEDINRIIARFAGAMSDRLGEGHRVEAPIFEHADFEHLEMEEPGSGDQADGAT